MIEKRSATVSVLVSKKYTNFIKHVYQVEVRFDQAQAVHIHFQTWFDTPGHTEHLF